MFWNRKNRCFVGYKGVKMPRKKEKEPTERQLRVSEEIRHVISDTLLRVDLYDADVKPSMVMITI